MPNMPNPDDVMDNLQNSSIKGTGPTGTGNLSNLLITTINGIYAGEANKNQVYDFSFDNEMSAYIFIMPNMADNKFTKDAITIPQITRDFILTSVAEERRENFQISETFEDASIFFFDQRVKIYSFSGYLIDSDHIHGLPTKDSQTGEITHGVPERSWSIKFKQFWDDTLRGTKLVEKKSIAIIAWNKNLVWGYPINLTINQEANTPFMNGFSFQMVVKKHKFADFNSVQLSILKFMSKAERAKFETDLKRLTDNENSIRDKQKKLETTVDTATESKLQKEINDLQNASEKLYFNLLNRLQLAIAFKK